MIPTDWTPHQRASDAELVGYLTEDADGTVPRTLFGAPLAAAGPRSAAVAVLESRGLGSLAQPWLLRRDDGEEDEQQRETGVVALARAGGCRRIRNNAHKAKNPRSLRPRVLLSALTAFYSGLRPPPFAEPIAKIEKARGVHLTHPG